MTPGVTIRDLRPPISSKAPASGELWPHLVRRDIVLRMRDRQRHRISAAAGRIHECTIGDASGGRQLSTARDHARLDHLTRNRQCRHETDLFACGGRRARPTMPASPHCVLPCHGPELGSDNAS